MRQKNSLNIDDSILFNIINENKNELISKINFEFDKAKFNLCNITTLTRRTKYSFNKVKVETRTITYYPDDTIAETDWIQIRIENKQFGDLITDVQDMFTDTYDAIVSACTYIARKFSRDNNTVYENEKNTNI